MERVFAKQEWRIPNYGEGHGTFTITAEIHSIGGQAPYFALTGWYKGLDGEWGGCCHDEIVAAMPTLAKYLKWHLCSITGPMHYVANTVWHAGDRDCWGRRASDVSRYEYGVRFGDSPITTHVNKEFWNWLENAPWYDLRYELQVTEVPYSGQYKLSPNYTLSMFPREWHKCPFKDYTSAAEFLNAMQNLPIELVQVPVEYSTGKERDFEAARRCAIWPDATDDELSQDRDTLVAHLNARLPALLDAFQADMIELFGDQIKFVKN